MKFECQESCGGKCCKPNWDGKAASFVFLTKLDRHRLGSFLQKPIPAFANYGEFDSTRFTMKKTRQWYIRPAADGSCPFLKNGRCGVYEARPTQCKTFPMWPELMVNTVYEDLKEFCPGVEKGETMTHRLLFEQIEADKELSGGS
jgi:Fe-S-cluster containining protein